MQTKRAGCSTNRHGRLRGLPTHISPRAGGGVAEFAAFAARSGTDDGDDNGFGLGSAGVREHNRDGGGEAPSPSPKFGHSLIYGAGVEPRCSTGESKNGPDHDQILS